MAVQAWRLDALEKIAEANFAPLEESWLCPPWFPGSAVKIEHENG